MLDKLNNKVFVLEPSGVALLIFIYLNIQVGPEKFKYEVKLVFLWQFNIKDEANKCY